MLLAKIRDDYNKIADIFNKTRDYLPLDVVNLGKYINQNDKVLDLGCGNGRLFELVSKKGEYYGVDISARLVEIAKERYPQAQFFLFDGLNLPFQDNFFDKVFCLAVFHHIPSEKYRLQFLKEIRRVLKPEGILVLTVWNLLPKKKTRRLLLKYTILKLIGKSKLDFFDIHFPWKDSRGKIIINRYVHIFRTGELKELFKSTGFLVQEIKVLKRSAKESNIFVLAKKV